jgi:ABC-type multidrug transport system fused ATPase/permease subunit
MYVCLPLSVQSLGDVFSALTGAVGAADKVLELMNRKPGVSAGGTLVPATFEGRIELRDVVFAYPARPHVKVSGVRYASVRATPRMPLFAHSTLPSLLFCSALHMDTAVRSTLHGSGYLAALSFPCTCTCD